MNRGLLEKQYQNCTLLQLENLMIESCAMGNLEAVEYLSENKELMNHLFNGTYRHGLICQSCKNGHLPVVKYLLTSPLFDTIIDIHAHDDLPFIYAAQNKHLDVVNFLILDMDIKKTERIKRYLEKSQDEELNILFRYRNTYKSFNNKEPNLEIPQKKIKL